MLPYFETLAKERALDASRVCVAMVTRSAVAASTTAHTDSHAGPRTMMRRWRPTRFGPGESERRLPVVTENCHSLAFNGRSIAERAPSRPERQGLRSAGCSDGRQSAMPVKGEVSP
jgi:hypothetical protein